MASREYYIDIAQNYYPDRSVPMTHAYMKMRFAARGLADALASAEEERGRLREALKNIYQKTGVAIPREERLYAIQLIAGKALSYPLHAQSTALHTTETEGSDDEN